MTSDRVWVTGVGLVTALGSDAATTWRRLVQGARGFAPLQLFDANSQRAAMVASVSASPALALPDHAPRTWSRTTEFAWKAASEAMARSGLQGGAAGRRRVGLVVGGTTGGMFEAETLLARLHADPHRPEPLGVMIAQPLTATGVCLDESLGPFCRVRTLCSACSSGANALVVGALWLLAGEVDAVVAGGADGLCRLTVSGFNALGASDPEACRPFDVNRKGLNLGEGAGFVVMERASSVRARQGEAIAELAGWAVGAEAHHITNPEPSGAAAAHVVTRCLRRAGLSPHDIDYVNAHGTATPRNDAMEAAALRLALGRDIERVAVSSSKGQVGHMLGAAGAVEAIISALSVRNQVMPPTMGLVEPDAACPLVHVLHRGQAGRVRAVLSDSFGFGGMDTVLALTEPELGPPLSRVGRRVVVSGAAALTASGLDDGTTAASVADGSLPGTPAAPSGPPTLDVAARLDVSRARRLDRSTRLGVVAAESALAEAQAGAAPLDLADVGVALGIAFGSLDASAAFMHHVLETGARFASPAAFPNLVPSSPVGHVSIYLGLRGATFAVADLETSATEAVTQGIELVAGGDADVIVAGAIEEASELVERVGAYLTHGPEPSREAPTARRARSEGAATLVLEDEAHALARGARPLASVAACVSWACGSPAALVGPRDPSRARVVSLHDDAEVASLVSGTAWATAPRTTVTRTADSHEAIGGAALVAAARMVHRGVAAEVLIVGGALGRRYAITLAAFGSQATLSSS